KATDASRSATLSASWTRDMGSPFTLDRCSSIQRCAPSIAPLIEVCQYRRMSKQESGAVDPGGAVQGYCPGLLRTPLGEDESVELARVFKALGDPVRLRLLSLIASRDGGEVCVCDLTPAFDLAQPTISHHLKLL